MSHFLFLIVMEAFSGMLYKAKELGFLKGIALPNGGSNISNFLYTDNTMLLGEWSFPNFKIYCSSLLVLLLCSGLKINFQKSFLLEENVSDFDITNMAC